MIAQTIQLALAPVFVLVAVGQLMNSLTVRLGRVVDRSREMQRQYRETTGMEHDCVVMEIRMLDRRIWLISNSILTMVLSGLAVAITVAMLFGEAIFSIDLQRLAAGIFMVALALLMAGLLLFLRETQVAAAMLRIPRDLLELDKIK